MDVLSSAKNNCVIFGGASGIHSLGEKKGLLGKRAKKAAIVGGGKKSSNKSHLLSAIRGQSSVQTVAAFYPTLKLYDGKLSVHITWKKKHCNKERSKLTGRQM